MKKSLLSLLLVTSFVINVRAQSFYDINTIQEIQLTFPFTNWDYRLDTAYSGSEGYILATSCVINGVPFDSVGVKYKGNSSYSANNAKNPLHIDLGWIKTNQDYDGYTDVKLGNGFSDASFIREALSYEILRNYMHASLANFAKVYINGEYWGLYSSAEHIGGRFVGEHFFSNHGTLIKCNPHGGAGPGGGVSPDLRYLGTNPSSYYNGYEMKNDDDWQHLINLCDTLNNYTPSVEKVLDIDRAIWMLAFNNVLVNLDSYTGGFRQNYYLYRDETNRFNSIVWDLNMSFGGFRSLSGGGPGGSNLDSTGMKNLALSANSTSTNHPLIMKIWANPLYRKMYIAHAKTITEEMFVTGYYLDRAIQLQAIVQDAYYTDPHKFFTDTQFDNSLYSNINGSGGPGGWGSMGIYNLMNGRVNYLMNTTEFTQTAPTISNVQVLQLTPTVFSNVWINAHVTDATNVKLAYRYRTPDIFTKIDMFDDGAHQDGIAGDGVYGAMLPLQSALTEYYIFAENSLAAKFAPQRAEYEFYSIHAAVPSIASGSLTINEVLAANTVGVEDANGQREDWVELKNNTNAPISLAACFLSNSPNDWAEWQFPDYAVIPANGYVTVWCDEDSRQYGYHANFKISKSGDEVLLSKDVDAAAVLLDSLQFLDQTDDASLARCPDGTGEFQPTILPTFGAANICTSVGTEDISATAIRIFPNPTSGALHIVSDDAIIQNIVVYNVLSQIIWTTNTATQQQIIDSSRWQKGMYYIRINQQQMIKFVVQ
ncbi:MAG: CotH kinase family protein [Saprospiraceae bacterium]|nr:CotH kinase family protein [Saprospiraceae bacterium]MBP7680002.1 CotH kinase family protein [Saprospiraceae bacterium]